ncbi:MAG: hypothetical protein DRP01_01665 [Archaeoglobales archaeon]|nr:MAG: hypothetical protein DRP01_01665 [Archaeoglobales archaeon]
MKIRKSWDGFKWAIPTDNPTPSDLDPLRPHELTVIETLKQVASPNKIFVDVGACDGMYAIRMAKYYKEVIAIEPDPSNIAVLKLNIALNEIENIEIMETAVSNFTGTGYLIQQGAQSHLVKTDQKEEAIEVPVWRLDDLIDECHVIKIDVEGHEENVIYGAYGLIQKCKPIMVIEHHEERGFPIKGSRQRIQSYLAKDYYMLALSEPHWLYIPKTISLRQFKEQVATHWFYFCLNNIKQGRPWYQGLFHNWWWGCSLLDFYKALPDYIDKEPEWIELIPSF